MTTKVLGKRKVCYSAFYIDFKIDVFSSRDRHVLQISNVRNGYRRCSVRGETIYSLLVTRYFLRVTCTVNRKKHLLTSFISSDTRYLLLITRYLFQVNRYILVFTLHFFLVTPYFYLLLVLLVRFSFAFSL